MASLMGGAGMMGGGLGGGMGMSTIGGIPAEQSAMQMSQAQGMLSESESDLPPQIAQTLNQSGEIAQMSQELSQQNGGDLGGQTQTALSGLQSLIAQGGALGGGGNSSLLGTGGGSSGLSGLNGSSDSGLYQLLSGLLNQSGSSEDPNLSSGLGNLS